MKKISKFALASSVAVSLLFSFTNCKADSEIGNDNSQTSSNEKSATTEKDSDDTTQTPAPEPEKTTPVKFDIKNFQKTQEIYAIPKGSSVTITISDDHSWNEYCNPKSDDIFKGVYTNGRKITLKPFLIGRYEVTQELYKAVMGNAAEFCFINNAESGEIQKYRPAECVNWFDAIVFCNRLSIKMGYDCVYSYDFSKDGSGEMTNPDDWFANTIYLSEKTPVDNNSVNYKNWSKVKIDLSKNGYRLPTEAEWEFAARGGDAEAEEWKYGYSGIQCITEIYCTNNEQRYAGKEFTGIMKDVNIVDPNLGKVGWYYKSKNKNNENCNEKTHEVGIIPNGANSLGIFDMSGNVFEWCNDFFEDDVSASDSNYYDENNVPTNPAGPATGINRVRRGGGWYGCAFDCSVSYRGFASPYLRNSLCGIRLVRSDWDD